MPCKHFRIFIVFLFTHPKAFNLSFLRFIIRAVIGDYAFANLRISLAPTYALLTTSSSVFLYLIAQTFRECCSRPYLASYDNSCISIPHAGVSCWAFQGVTLSFHSKKKLVLCVLRFSWYFTHNPLLDRDLLDFSDQFNYLPFSFDARYFSLSSKQENL